MSNAKIKIPIKDLARRREFLPTLEELEEWLGDGDANLCIYQSDPKIREIFRANFESESAKNARTIDRKRFYGDEWMIAEEVESLSLTAAKTECDPPGGPYWYLNPNEDTIRKAREDLGGHFARLIKTRDFASLDRLIKSLKSPAENERRKTPLLQILKAISGAGRLLSASELQERVQQPSADDDPSNFRRRLKKFGIWPLPKRYNGRWK